MNGKLALVFGILFLSLALGRKLDDEKKEKVKEKKAQKEDEKREKQIKGKIVNGTAVQGSAVPYQASIMQVGKGHFCGGSIISPQHILTAAHCLHDMAPQQLTVRTGATEVNRGGNVVPVAQIFRHPNYNKNTVDNDLAIIRTGRPITVGKMIRLAANEPPANTWALVTGWGLPDEDADNPTRYLNYAWMPIMTRDACQVAYNRLNTITRNMICAGFKAGQVDACQGDSGGPMVVDNLQVGVVSWGRGCARAGNPGVFASVPANINWIMKVVNGH